jgi:predicted thioesterase
VHGGYGRGHLLRCPEAFSQGRKLRFKLECQDEKEIIGTGFHERAVIDPARFLAQEKEAAG